MALRLFDALGEIAERVERSRHLLLSLDFEGVLVTHGDSTGEAVLSRKSLGSLQRLADSRGVSVLLFSSRSRAELLERVGVAGLIYAGNHGLEISGRGLLFVEPTALTFREPLQDLSSDLSGRLRGITGVTVEDRGLSLALMDRSTSEADAEAVRHAVHAALAANSHPFVLTTGPRLYEIRPRVYWDHAAAIAWVKEKLAEPAALTLMLIGNETQETASTTIPEGIAIRVGDAAGTTAPYSLEGPAEVEAFLEWLGEIRNAKSEVPNPN